MTRHARCLREVHPSERGLLHTRALVAAIREPVREGMTLVTEEGRDVLIGRPGPIKTQLVQDCAHRACHALGMAFGSRTMGGRV